MKALSIEDTLKKENSEFKFWSGMISTEILNKACPKCGTNILCAYSEMGVSDFCDTYHHICVNNECDFIKKRDEFGIGMGTREESGPTPCPFCNREVF
jgi:hypothetical protein